MRNVMSVLFCAGIGMVFFAPSAEAQYSNVSSVINGFGGSSSGGTYTHISAGAQPGGIGTSYEGGPSSYAGGQINRAGFLNTFVMFPDRDTRGNGLPDELDPDNDGDGLWDHWEVSGEKFTPLTPTDPNLADTDIDGISDFDEMLAGTNPQDPDSAFKLVSIEHDGGFVTVGWQARGNHERTYVLRVRDDSYDDVPNIVIFSNTVAGGVAPWYAVTNTLGEPPVDAGFYAVEVLAP